MNDLTKKQKTLILLLVFIIMPFFYSLSISSPEGTSVRSDEKPGRVRFIRDLTYEKNGRTIHEHNILREEIRLINRAEEFILLDMFLFNDTYNKDKDSYPNVSDSLMLSLIKRKKEKPELDIVFITDPYNEFYGSYKEKHLAEMEQHGIVTIVTDLDKMRDSNPLYSGFYRVYLRWLGTGGAWIPNPMDSTAPGINLRSLLKLLNMKANHRKTLCTDKGAIVSSANPHDPSCFHSNVAIFLESDVINDIIESERAVAEFSGTEIKEFRYKYSPGNDKDMVRLVTDGAIGKELRSAVKETEAGDSITMGIFYISEFGLLKELGDAVERGVSVKIIADPNKDAFGMKKNGRPNREALTRLKKKHPAAEIRWYSTTGEQYHTKMAFIEMKDKNRLIAGSSNYTRRNMDGYNMESDLSIETPADSALSVRIGRYFEKLWNNEDAIYTVDFEKFRKESTVSCIFYMFQEALGLCSW